MQRSQMMSIEPQRRILRLRDVQAATGLSASSIYQLVKERRFPHPIKLSERRSGWVKSEVDGWIEARVSEREALLNRSPYPARNRHASPGSRSD